MGSDYSDILSESEFVYGVDGYMFEHTRSDGDTCMRAVDDMIA